jgi:hypothetical protein
MSLSLFGAGDGLTTRAWNGTPISRRTTDGYVNATAMAKASGKEWFNYAKSERVTTYMEALSRNLQMEVSDLCLAKPGEGTWIHPQLAVDFARWISAEFAVWMDAWFLDELATRASQVQSAQPVLLDAAFQESLGAAEALAALVQRVGGDPKQSVAKSLTVVARHYRKSCPQLSQMCLESQRLLNPAVDEYLTSTRLLEQLMETVGERETIEFTKAAKNAGLIQKVDPRCLINGLLVAMGYQVKGGGRRDQPSYIPVNEGVNYSVTEIRPDINNGEAKVPQLVWHTSVINPICDYLLRNFNIAPANG